MTNQIDAEGAARVNAEKLEKQLRLQLDDMSSKADDQARQLHDLVAHKTRLLNENTDIARQLEEGEVQLTNLLKLKSQYMAEIDETRRTGDADAREKQALKGQAKNVEYEVEKLRAHRDEEEEGKSEVLRQLNKAEQEVSQLKSQFEGDVLIKLEMIEEAKRQVQQKIRETEVN